MVATILTGDINLTAFLFAAAGALVLADGLYLAGYATSIAVLKNTKLFDSDTKGTVVRCIVAAIGWFGVFFGTMLAIDHLPIQDVSEIMVQLALAFAVLAVSNCAMVVGGQHTVVAIAANIRSKVADRTMGRKAAYGKMGPDDDSTAPKPSAFVKWCSMTGAAGMLAGGFWLHLIVSVGHSAYASFAFLVTISLMVTAVYASHLALSTPDRFLFPHWRTADSVGKLSIVLFHAMRAIIVLGCFGAYAYVVSIISTCNGAAL